MRRLSVVLALTFTTLGVRADPLFDRGLALAALAGNLMAAERARDAAAVMALFQPNDDIAYYERATEAWGRDAALAAVDGRLAELPAGGLVATAPRILVEAATGWIVVDWEWGGASGRQIARARRNGGEWAFDALDFDGESADGGIGGVKGGFDASAAISAVDGPIQAMEQGAVAFSEGDEAAMDAVIVAEKDDFVFTTADGDRWQGRDGIVRAGFAVVFNEVPEGVAREEMTLFVGAGLGRAIAFQTIDGQRVSLLLERRDRWRVVEASLGPPLDILPVAAPRSMTTTWAHLRRRSR